jgi:hypothetical protein
LGGDWREDLPPCFFGIWCVPEGANRHAGGGPGGFPFSAKQTGTFLFGPAARFDNWACGRPLVASSLLLHKIKLHEQINIETKKNSKQFSEKDKTITRSYRPLPRHTLEETPSLHHCKIQKKHNRQQPSIRTRVRWQRKIEKKSYS